MIQPSPADAAHGIASKHALYTADYPTVPRCMAFIDISSFTSFANDMGNHAAASMVADFRAIVRTTSGRHSIRVARWIGDAVMLVGLNAKDVIEALCDIAAQCYAQDIAVHCGLADGQVIIFEGDDYIGSIVNIASRLAHVAGSSELYAYNIRAEHIPAGLAWLPHPSVKLRGVGMLDSIKSIQLIQ
jgi:class 3 adenylate cyclase